MILRDWLQDKVTAKLRHSETMRLRYYELRDRYYVTTISAWTQIILRWLNREIYRLINGVMIDL